MDPACVALATKTSPDLFAQIEAGESEITVIFVLIDLPPLPELLPKDFPTRLAWQLALRDRHQSRLEPIVEPLWERLRGLGLRFLHGDRDFYSRTFCMVGNAEAVRAAIQEPLIKLAVADKKIGWELLRNEGNKGADV